MLALADADDQRAAFTRGDDGIGMILVQQYDDVGAYHSFEGDTEGLFQSAIIVFLNVFDEVEQYFGVGIAFEVVPFFEQFGLELGIGSR